MTWRQQVIDILVDAGVTVINLGFAPERPADVTCIVRPSGRAAEGQLVCDIIVYGRPTVVHDPDENLEADSTKVWEILRELAIDVTVTGPIIWTPGGPRPAPTQGPKSHRLQQTSWTAMVVTATDPVRPGIGGR